MPIDIVSNLYAGVKVNGLLSADNMTSNNLFLMSQYISSDPDLSSDYFSSRKLTYDQLSTQVLSIDLERWLNLREIEKLQVSNDISNMTYEQQLSTILNLFHINLY